MSTPFSDPPGPRRGRRSIALSLVSLLAAPLLVACGAPEPPRAPDVYRVRGIVRQLPTTGHARDLHVRHEAIPSFLGSDGEIVGMESMTMPFPLADASLGDGLEVGDKIELEFEVRWDEGHPLRVTAIEELPFETQLNFKTTDSETSGDTP